MKSPAFISQKIKSASFYFLLTISCFSTTVPVHSADDVTVKNTTTLVNSIELPNSPCSFSGDFIQIKTIAGLDKTLESSGSFYYHCQAGVIWSTRSPINETLIFSRTGNNAQIKENEVSKLKGRQSKLLGKLLNSMMSGNQAEIEQQFALNTIDSTTNEFELLPKKKSLKRAIKQIQLMFTQTSDDKVDSNLNKIDIQILDRKNQLTKIESTQSNTFESRFQLADSDKLRYSQCMSSGITSLACDQLYPQPE